FHALPLAVHELGAAFNHLVEVVAPFGLFGPRRVRHVAGVLVVVFQFVLILSGNLSFLNWLTIVVALAAFDDSFFERLWPGRLGARLRARLAALGDGTPPSPRRTLTLRLLVGAVAFLSVFPVVNMLSP